MNRAFKHQMRSTERWQRIRTIFAGRDNLMALYRYLVDHEVAGGRAIGPSLPRRAGASILYMTDRVRYQQ